MTNKPTIAVLIVAAGSGERFGAALPKQYQPLLGRPVLRWGIDTFRQHPDISAVYVAISDCHAELYDNAVQGLSLPPPIIGGATRQETVRHGLEAIAQHKKPDYVLIHDAARPAVSAALITRVCAALKKNEAVIPGLAVTDTVKRLGHDQLKTESRDGLYTVQTPQGFRFDTILHLHRKHKDKSLTDDAALCEADGPKVAITEGDKANFKVTHAEDLIMMELALATQRADLRTGTGYDVHCLVEQKGRPLMLCGIEVPHALTLEGHSDADVGLHAITDAILGAICNGDIGMHFSPKNPEWKNADSARFLRHAADLVAAQGGVITHIDVTLICEEPKIGPHREKMRQRIGEITGLPLSRVSVKAKTTEGLGFTGRKEGIAAEAVATVRLPFAVAEQEIDSGSIRKWGT